MSSAKPKASKREAALVKAFSDFAKHHSSCSWGGYMVEGHDRCNCGLSAAIRACPPLRKAFKNEGAQMIRVKSRAWLLAAKWCEEAATSNYDVDLAVRDHIIASVVPFLRRRAGIIERTRIRK